LFTFLSGVVPLPFTPGVVRDDREGKSVTLPLTLDESQK